MTFTDALLRRGIQYRASSVPDEIYVCCPFCSDHGEAPDTRFRLGVNVKRGLGHCFNCGWKSRHAVATILKKFSIQAPVDIQDSKGMEEQQDPVLPDDFQPLSRPADDLDQAALDYVIRRGVTPAQVRAHGLGVSYTGKYAYRIIFPAREGRKLLCFTARDFTGHREPKYLGSPGRKWLYNRRGAEQVILSEGVFKALRIEQLGTGWDSCCMFGHDLTDQQMEQLGGAREVAIWPDPDAAGRRGAVHVAEKLLAGGFNVKVIWPVERAADEEPLPAMAVRWRTRTSYSLALHDMISLHIPRSSWYNILAVRRQK